MYGATPTSNCPLLQCAQTTTGTQDTSTATPNLSRPLPARKTSSNAISRPVAQNPNTTNNPRPSFLRRVTSIIDNTLELSAKASYAYRNRPVEPSHWTDHAHLKALVKTWDAVHEASACSKSKYPKTVAGQLVATEKSFLEQFPELAYGEVVLGREWIEYVLGTSLRHPFCAEGKMGMWEVLGGATRASGLRAWGQW
jgi:hypothetical protein